VDEKTRELMEKPRCGVQDNVASVEDATLLEDSEIEDARRKRYIIQKSVQNGQKWRRRDLKYRVTKYSQKIPSSVVDGVLRKAFYVRIDPSFEESMLPSKNRSFPSKNRSFLRCIDPFLRRIDASFEESILSFGKSGKNVKCELFFFLRKRNGRRCLPSILQSKRADLCIWKSNLSREMAEERLWRLPTGQELGKINQRQRQR
jgi:hypothetical protein